MPAFAKASPPEFILLPPTLSHVKPSIAVVGCGAWGRNLVKDFHKLGALEAICDASAPNLEAALRVAPGTRSFATLAEVLADPAIQAVAIATPAETHAALARQALHAGKDVFVEKPMTVATADAELLVREAAAAGRILMVGHLLLHSPMVRRVKELIDEGQLGTVQHVAVKRAKQGKVRAHENVMWSFACHDIAAVLHLLDRRQPIHVQAVGRSFVQPAIEDDTHLHLRFDGGASAHIHSSWYWPDNERSYIVLGDRNWLRMDEVAGTIRLYRKGINPDLGSRDEGSQLVEFDSTQPLEAECRHFLDCIRTRNRPRSDGAQGLDVVRILEWATTLMRQERGPSS